MEDANAKFGTQIENFIKNPLGKYINPKHIVSVVFEKKRSKSLLRKIKSNFQVEEKEPIIKSDIEGVMTPEQLLDEMEKKDFIDKKLRKLLREQLYANPLRDGLRRKLWFIASGAKVKQDIEPDYYKKLSEELTNYPVYFEPIIELDIKRTFPGKPYDSNDIIVVKMRRILNSYAKRNPFIGYCQGLNFVVARILEVVDNEEESFWILCALLEDILPIDYFSSMVGVLIDQKVFSEMVSNFDKELGKKFSDLEVDPSLFSLQWFVCCYVSTFSLKLANLVWDLLFLEGPVLLFKVGLVFLTNLKPKILAVQEFNEIFSLIEENQDFTKDYKKFLKDLQQIYLSKKLLRIIRRQYQWIIEEELQTLENKKKTKKNFLPPKEALSCNLSWPVCTDVLEKSKQKKRNPSVFVLRADRGKAIKSNYLSTEFKHTHHHKNQLLKKMLKNKERGRDRQIKIGMAPEKKQHLLKSSEPEDHKSSFELNGGNGHSLKRHNDQHHKNEPSVERIKISENPFIIQNYLVIGRHKHTCQESKEPWRPLKRHPTAQQIERDSRMEEYVKNNLADFREDKSPIPMRMRHNTMKTEGKEHQIVFEKIQSKPIPEKKESGGVSSILKGLFGGSFMAKRDSPKEDKSKKKQKKGGHNDISYSSEEEIPSPKILVRKAFLETDEENTTRTKPKKSIYNYLMETDFNEIQDKNIDSEKKSILFMREFFKE